MPFLPQGLCTWCQDNSPSLLVANLYLLHFQISAQMPFPQKFFPQCSLSYRLSYYLSTSHGSQHAYNFILICEIIVKVYLSWETESIMGTGTMSVCSLVYLFHLRHSRRLSKCLLNAWIHALSPHQVTFTPNSLKHIELPLLKNSNVNSFDLQEKHWNHICLFPCCISAPRTVVQSWSLLIE